MDECSPDEERRLAIPVPGPGRDSAYQPEFADQARKLCLLGFTDKELAKFFGVSTRTINNWKHAYPAFLQSILAGKDYADAEVADSLYRRAAGEEIIVERAMKTDDGKFEIVRLKQFVPGDVQAQRLWLLNRRKGNWRDKVEQEVTVKGDLASRIIAARKRAAGSREE